MAWANRSARKFFFTRAAIVCAGQNIIFLDNSGYQEWWAPVDTNRDSAKSDINLLKTIENLSWGWVYPLRFISVLFLLEFRFDKRQKINFQIGNNQTLNKPKEVTGWRDVVSDSRSMTGTCDTFKMFSFSVMQSTFRFSNVEILAVPTTSLIYNLWTEPKARSGLRSGQIRFALRDHLSGMWQGRQVRMPNINSEQ